MGKNKHNNDEHLTDVSSLYAEQKKIARKIEQAKIPCSHTNAKGKLKVKFQDNNLVKCTRCGTVFSFEPVSMKELKQAVQTVHNVINQCKALSNDPQAEKDLIKTLGNMDFNLTELLSLYERISTNGDKKKKKDKKKNKGDHFGESGMNAILFDSRR